MRIRQFYVKNQFLIRDDDGNEFLQSYNSIIVKKDRNGKITLGRDWDYSNTTGRYRNLYLGESKKETEALLKSGEYILDLTL